MRTAPEQQPALSEPEPADAGTPVVALGQVADDLARLAGSADSSVAATRVEAVRRTSNGARTALARLRSDGADLRNVVRIIEVEAARPVEAAGPFTDDFGGASERPPSDSST